MMKNNSLIKAVTISFLLIVLLSCFIDTSVVNGLKINSIDVNSIGITGIFNVIVSVLSQNLGVFIFIITVGIMYGVLNKTHAYQNLINKIVSRFETNKKVLIIIPVILFALISSLLGVNVELFLLVPFVVAVLFNAGYDRITVFASTIGSILIGLLGATFNTTVLSTINVYYQLPYTHLIVIKIFILLLCLYLYLINVLKSAKISQVSDLEISNYEVTKEKRNIVPVSIYLVIITLLVLAGVFKFGDIVGFEIFSTVKEGLYTIPVLNNILGEVSVFGTYTYIDLSYMLFIGTLLIAFIYNVKLDDMINGMKKGAGDVMGAAFIFFIVSTIPTITSTYSFYLTIIDKLLMLFDGFNIFISTIATFITSILVPNISLGATSLLPVINATLDGDVNSLSLIIQTIYGIVMLISPTSSLLVLGLSYCKVGYLDWLKYFVKVFLYIMIVLVAVFIITVLI